MVVFISIYILNYILSINSYIHTYSTFMQEYINTYRRVREVKFLGVSMKARHKSLLEGECVIICDGYVAGHLMYMVRLHEICL